MKRDYILINSKKLNIPNWGKWIILYLICNITPIVVGILGLIIAFHMGVDFSIRYQVSYYIDAFIMLTFIHDLAPKFKKFFSTLASMWAIIMYKGSDYMYGSLPVLVFIVIVIFYNIILYKKFAKT